jgi:hypothetical protein
VSWFRRFLGYFQGKHEYTIYLEEQIEEIKEEIKEEFPQFYKENFDADNRT